MKMPALFSFAPVTPFEPVRDSSVPDGEQWIHQIKWDGVRMLSYFDGKECRLFNRKGNERTQNYPELVDVRSYSAAGSFIMDGEIIALGADGKPSFHEVMRRDAIRKKEKVASAQKAVQITYMIFDILYYEGEWTTGLPLIARDSLLSEAIRPSDKVQKIVSFKEGQPLFDLMRQQGMEGIISKNLQSTYACSGKDRRWIKVKNYGDLVVVIGGFTLNGGTVNAILAGIYDTNGQLHYIGHVGTGTLARTEWGELTKRLRPTIQANCPFVNNHPDMKGATWVKPLFTARIMYSEWRWREGRTLRHPSIQAFVDIPPHECVFQAEKEDADGDRH
ncbi:ATP-dependent DNA ligase [Paenibacillus eucommiae]|uniref:DNA ligase (ATP) n=1 Tax=Paenibacillus eucommiae TaxID=1355755 RepID=A0ABS4J584_9BACL|nr:RNA ligase family protein [Paenibacillus eucommiae]MBP1995004.1 bifunctional non-homologous end joining protein LigD [Paenibacillus eucommiae]